MAKRKVSALRLFFEPDDMLRRALEFLAALVVGLEPEQADPARTVLWPAPAWGGKHTFGAAPETQKPAAVATGEDVFQASELPVARPG